MRPVGPTACSLGRKPQVARRRKSLSPEGAAADLTGRAAVAPPGLDSFLAPQPGARAPGYMPSALRAWK